MNPEFLKAIDPLVRRFGGYTAYQLDQDEFIGTVSSINEDAYGYLKYAFKYELGYEEPPRFFGVSLEAAKLHPKTKDVHTYSYRKVDSENKRKQFHIHVWERGAYSEIYSHHEFRPDVRILKGETLGEAIERLQTHYRPDWSTFEYQQGKADKALLELVE